MDIDNIDNVNQVLSLPSNAGDGSCCNPPDRLISTFLGSLSGRSTCELPETRGQGLGLGSPVILLVKEDAILSYHPADAVCHCGKVLSCRVSISEGAQMGRFRCTVEVVTLRIAWHTLVTAPFAGDL